MQPQTHDGRVDRGGLLAHRPALLGAQPAAAAALAAGIANDQVAMLAQIVQRQFSPKLMERMPGCAAAMKRTASASHP